MKFEKKLTYFEKNIARMASHSLLLRNDFKMSVHDRCFYISDDIMIKLSSQLIVVRPPNMFYHVKR